jgi:hypothetical protein
MLTKRLLYCWRNWDTDHSEDFQKYIAVYLSRKERSKKEKYCRILTKKRRSWTRKVLQEFLSRRKEQYFRKYSPEHSILENLIFSEECPNSQKPCPNTTGRKFEFPACPSIPANTSHSKVLFSHMSGHLADISSRKSLFCIMSGHRSQESGQRKVFHADV